MKLIIDIPEKVVTAIQNGEDYRFDIHTAIAQGIPYKERPKGEWLEICDIKSWQFTNEHYECDKCHYKGNKSNFCPNCGEDMRGDVE